MIHCRGRSADVVWRQLVHRLARTGVLQESRDQPTRELLHVGITITDPRQRLVFARTINPAFALAEAIWLLAGANDLAFLRFWNPRMRHFSDDHQTLHGAYGFRLGSQPTLGRAAVARLRHERPGSPPRLDQLRAACEALRTTPHSRQVVLQMWDAGLDLPNPTPRSKDVPCNVLSHLMVRNGKLEWLQVMRSNDLFWGLPYNLVQFTTMQEIMAGWLGVNVGTYCHISDSLHAYQRHWSDLDDPARADRAVPVNRADLRVGAYGDWERIWARLVELVLRLTELRRARELHDVATEGSDLPGAYREWIAVLTAEALARRGHRAAAETMIAGAGPFWGESWRRWRAHKARNPNPPD